MKKILSILSIVAAAVMMTVCVSCKKDEPSNSKGLDFTNLTIELLENCIDKDLDTINNILKEQGFVESVPYSRVYINKSYGIEYVLRIPDYGPEKITGAEGNILYPNENDRKKYLNTEKNIKDKKLPYFVGYFADSNWENRECTDNVNFYSENIKTKQYSASYYANETKSYSIGWIDTKKDGLYGYWIMVYKSNPDDPYNEYNYAKYGCGYDPYK